MKLPLCYLATKASWVLCKQVLSPLLGKSTATSMLIDYSANTLKISRFTCISIYSLSVEYALSCKQYVKVHSTIEQSSCLQVFEYDGSRRNPLNLDLRLRKLLSAFFLFLEKLPSVAIMLVPPNSRI